MSMYMFLPACAMRVRVGVGACICTCMIQCMCRGPSGGGLSGGGGPRAAVLHASGPSGGPAAVAYGHWRTSISTRVSAYEHKQ